MGRGVVLDSQSFNGENAWMLKRKWVECWDISVEFWVHYWNFNGARAGRVCEFGSNRSGIVRSLNYSWSSLKMSDNCHTNEIHGLVTGSHAGPLYLGRSIIGLCCGWVLVCEYELSIVIIHNSGSGFKHSCKSVPTHEVWFMRPWFETLWAWRQGWVTALRPECNQSIQKQLNYLVHNWQSIHSLPETQSCPPDEPSLLQHLCHRGLDVVLEALRRDWNLDSVKWISQRRI